MISGVFGLPRSGKTTFLTYIAQRALKGKQVKIGHWPLDTKITDFAPYQAVFTTFPCRGCYQLQWEMIGKLQFENCLILIDEISHYCDNRDWKNFTADLRYFFTMHGHMKIDIIYCSQYYTDVDKKIQNMTEQLLLIKKRGAFSRVSPISLAMDVNRSGPIHKYYLASSWGSLTFRRKKYYTMFNSFDFRRLPAAPFVPWEYAKEEEKNPPGVIKKRIKKL